MDNYSHAFLHGSVGYEAQEDKLERREDDIFAKPDLKPESARETAEATPTVGIDKQ